MNTTRKWQPLAVSALAAVALTLAACGQNNDSKTAEKAATKAPAQETASQNTPAELAIAQKIKLTPGGLYEMAYNPANNSLYVASTGKRGADDSSVVQLNADNLTVEKRIKLKQSVFGLALDANSQTLYGTNTVGGKLVVIDLKTGKVEAAIGTGEKAHLRSVRLDLADDRAYVSTMGREKGANGIWVVDTNTNKLLNVIKVNAPSLTGIALDASGNRVFAVSRKANSISVVDLDTQKTVANWPTEGKGSLNAEYDADNNRLFVTNFESGTLTVLNATDGKLLATVKTGDGALGVAYDAERNRIYVTNRKAGTTSVINGETYKVIKQVSTGTYPQTVVVNQANGNVYVDNKAKGLPRDAPKDAVPPKDPNGDTVVLIK